MAKISLEFPDGSRKEFEKGAKGEDIAKGIGPRLAKDALAVKFNGEILDLTRPITASGNIKILTFSDKEGKEVFWHSAAHVLANAVKRLFPRAKLAIGPAIDEGFYYDFDADEPFKPEDLARIESEMKKIVAEGLPFERIELSLAEAKKRLKDEPYKVEMAEELGKDITIYKNREFIDLCRGPHVKSTGIIKAFKLTKTAGAYWKGNAKNRQLQRIYGIAFPAEKDMKEYMQLLEEAEKRDHMKIGKQMELFSIHPEGPGFIFWHDKGLIIFNELVKYWREEHRKAGYLEVKTPMMLNKTLWEASGHWKLYKEMMYTTRIDEQDYAIKPMNCPGGMLIYNTRAHSYKEMPLRVGEIGHVHRHELSGVLRGLLRVRAFTQDDAHIFCTPEQLEDEIINVIKLVQKMLETCGFKDYKFTLSVRSEEKKDKYLGEDKGWEWAESCIKNALKRLKIEYELMPGEAKFYGPSLDVQIRDALKREWQCSTIQLDFNMPELFDITYDGEDGRKHRPYILHRVVYGSIERFIGVLIEHYAGRLPLWLSPVQAIVMTVADRFEKYAEEVRNKMDEAWIRAEADYRAESIPKKVRDSQVRKIPLIVNIGEKEEKAGTVAVRTLDGKVKFGVKAEEFIKAVKKNIEERKVGIDFL